MRSAQSVMLPPCLASSCLPPVPRCRPHPAHRKLRPLPQPRKEAPNRGARPAAAACMPTSLPSSFFPPMVPRSPVLHTPTHRLPPPPPRPSQIALDDEEGLTRAKLLELEKRYADVPRAKRAHPDTGCWWALYDYGLERIKTWAPDYVHPYPGSNGLLFGGGEPRVWCVWLSTVLSSPEQLAWGMFLQRIRHRARAHPHAVINP